MELKIGQGSLGISMESRGVVWKFQLAKLKIVFSPF